MGDYVPGSTSGESIALFKALKKKGNAAEVATILQSCCFEDFQQKDEVEFCNNQIIFRT